VLLCVYVGGWVSSGARKRQRSWEGCVPNRDSGNLWSLDKEVVEVIEKVLPLNILWPKNESVDIRALLMNPESVRSHSVDLSASLVGNGLILGLPQGDFLDPLLDHLAQHPENFLPETRGERGGVKPGEEEEDEKCLLEDGSNGICKYRLRLSSTDSKKW